MRTGSRAHPPYPPRGFASFTRTARQTPHRYSASSYLRGKISYPVILSVEFYNSRSFDFHPFPAYSAPPRIRITNQTTLALTHPAHKNGITIWLGLKPKTRDSPTNTSRQGDTRSTRQPITTSPNTSSATTLTANKHKPQTFLRRNDVLRAVGINHTPLLQ